MDFTGERFHPDCTREIWYEHWHRYVFAREFVKDKNVLDVACGEGYGSHLLAKEARYVTGVDINAESVEQAQNKYISSNLEYVQANALSLAFEAETFDCVISFETLEHLSEHESLLAELTRVLKKDGLLLISTPDKKFYSDETGYQNPYHVKELYKNEFENLLAQYFNKVSLLQQKLMFSSTISGTDFASAQFMEMDAESGEIFESPGKPTYHLAVCANGELPQSYPNFSVFTDSEASVYEHYNDEVRRNIHARGVLEAYEQQLQEKDLQIVELRTELNDIKSNNTKSGKTGARGWLGRLLKMLK